MSDKPQSLTLPLRSANAATTLSSDSTSNVNQGAGTQHNSTQAGEHNNQYNAENQNFHYHGAPRSQVKQPWRLPRQAAGNYAGYTEVSARLEACFLGPEPDDEQIIFVLSGMGGVGKSEAVLQFLKRHNRELRKRFWAAFWIDCTSVTTARADFKSIGNLCGWTADNSDLFCGAKDQLASLNERTLLILDNCDDPKTNFSSYIPNSPQVSVLLTTRLSDAGKYASPAPQDSNQKLFLRLDGLDQDSAVILILKSSEARERSEKALQQAYRIATALEGHPLALVVASSLIKGTTYSLEEYADALARRLTHSELLNIESEQATYRKVSTTFEVSADVLKKMAMTDPSAQQALALLDILGFMHHQGISEDIFLRAWEYAESVTLHCRDECWEMDRLTSWHVTQSQYFDVHGKAQEQKRGLRGCRAHLVRLSLVSIDPTSGSISLHSLVNTWARERLHHQSEAWTAAASILALSTENRRDWQAFTPSLASHVETCFALREYSEATVSVSLEVSRIWLAFGGQMYHTRSPRLLALYEHMIQDLACKESSEQFLVEAQYRLGIVYQDAGETSRAIEILEHVVKLREKKLAEDHPNRLAPQHELASAYQADGQISRAIEIFENNLKIEKTTLAKDHPDQLVSQIELASAYLADRQTPRAIEILEHVVKVQEKRLAEDHHNRLASQHELARAYLAARQIPRAIEILEHVVKVEEKKLAEDHHNRLGSQHELARAYLLARQIPRAIEILEHVVEVEEKKLAEDHPKRLISQQLLAAAYWKIGQRIEAEHIMKRVVAIRQTCLRADHPARLKSERSLAVIVKQISRPSSSSPGSFASAGQDADDESVPTSSEGATGGAGVQEEESAY